jgi:hypothetical protein
MPGTETREAVPVLGRSGQIARGLIDDSADLARQEVRRQGRR